MCEKLNVPQANPSSKYLSLLQCYLPHTIVSVDEEEVVLNLLV